MSTLPDRSTTHPVHAVALAGTLPLFLGALLSDWAYASSEHVQWANFAQWLLAGGLVFAAIPLVLALVRLVARRDSGTPSVMYLLVLLAMWVIGFINSLVHARDAWAVMPTGPLLSAIVLVLSLVAIWLCFARTRVGGGR